jgi:hypothetical protein
MNETKRKRSRQNVESSHPSSSSSESEDSNSSSSSSSSSSSLKTPSLAVHPIHPNLISSPASAILAPYGYTPVTVSSIPMIHPIQHPPPHSIPHFVPVTPHPSSIPRSIPRPVSKPNYHAKYAIPSSASVPSSSSSSSSNQDPTRSYVRQTTSSYNTIRVPTSIISISTDGRMKKRTEYNDFGMVLGMLKTIYEMGYPLEIYVLPRNIVQQTTVPIEWEG